MFTNLVAYKLPGMDIQELRRANLRRWTQSHSVPPKEKSYFSQLTKGNASFGERAARRLERDYGMGEGFLDAAVEEQMEIFSTPEDALPKNNWPFSFPRSDFERLKDEDKEELEKTLKAYISWKLSSYEIEKQAGKEAVLYGIDATKRSDKMDSLHDAVEAAKRLRESIAHGDARKPKRGGSVS